MKILFPLSLFFILLNFSCQAQQICMEEHQLYTDISALKNRLDPKKVSLSRKDSIATMVKVVRVSDGDTAEVMYGNLYLSIRFDHIDAPETRGGQAFSQAARRYLIKLIEGKEVILVTQRKAQGGFGRFLGTFYTEEGLNVNKAMLAMGYAWHYTAYSDDLTYAKIEKCAKENKIGLWKDAQPIAPWDWRKGKRK